VKKRVFICDNDLELVQALTSFLSDKYDIASSVLSESLAAIEGFDPDVIVAGFEEPTDSGLHPFREISQAGLIFISGHINDAIELKMFAAGCDHILQKPFHLDQLEFRIQSILRLRQQSEIKNPTIKFGDLEVQPLDRTVKIKSRVVPLSPLHFEIVLAFAKHPERLLSRMWLRQNIWHNGRVSLRTVDAHISKLKKEIPELEGLIFNIYGEGYMLSLQRRAA
jgi:DNA-binding response OmpR family regulator